MKHGDDPRLPWLIMLQRRSCAYPGVAADQHVMEVDGVLFDGRRRRVQVDGYLIHLPAREAAVLGVLMAHPGQVVYHATLASAALSHRWAHRRAVDRLLRRLGRRLEPSPVSPARLHRVAGTGYIFGSTSPSVSPAGK